MMLDLSLVRVLSENKLSIYCGKYQNLMHEWFNLLNNHFGIMVCVFPMSGQRNDAGPLAG